MYDVSVLGSTVARGFTKAEALNQALETSQRPTFVTRLLRVHDVDGITVIAEVRNGRLLHVA